MAGTRRMTFGGILILASFFLIVGGAIAGSLPVSALGSFLFLFAIVAVIWGAVAATASWWAARRSTTGASYPSSAAQTFIPPPPPAPLPPPPPPPTRPQQSKTSDPAMSESTHEPSYTYAVGYVEEGISKSTSFATYSPAFAFYRHSNVGTRTLLRISPGGTRTVIGPAFTPPPPRVPQLDRVSNFLEHYRPSDRFGREREYEIELAQALRNEFGRLNVQRQVPIPQGIIDILVCGVGIELKIAGTAGSLQRLPEQIAGYREHFGPNLFAMIFDDTGDQAGVNEVRQAVESGGTQVFIK